MLRRRRAKVRCNRRAVVAERIVRRHPRVIEPRRERCAGYKSLAIKKVIGPRVRIQYSLAAAEQRVQLRLSQRLVLNRAGQNRIPKLRKWSAAIRAHDDAAHARAAATQSC